MSTPASVQQQQKNKGPKACTTCAKAKARCISGPEGSLKCDRCTRLNKPCLSQTPAPPRARKSPKLSKIAALEKRLEELSSHVQDGSSQPNEVQAEAGNKKQQQPPDCYTTDKWNFGHLFPMRTAAVVGEQGVTQTPSPPHEQQPQHAHGERHQPWDSWWPTPQEAAMLLEAYRTVHSPLFPFALVPAHMSSLELRQHRPFLWKAVMMVGCFLDGARQVKLGRELLGEIGQAAVVDGARNLDLLQGLQMLLAWFHYALKGSQVTNLLFLARAMCVNLAFKDDPSLQGEERETNLDHMRAYAGTYYLNTLVFTANKRHDVLMNTELLQTCCKVLESTMQYPSDEYLVKLVRIQHLAQSISLTMAVNMDRQVMRSFQDQLNLFSSSLSPELAQNDALKTHVHIAEVLLYEMAISDQRTAEAYVLPADRLQLLWECLRALRSFYDTRFAHRELERPRFLCLSASDFAFALITGVRLLTLQVPGWNLPQVQAELHMMEVMDSQIRDLVIIVARRATGLWPDAAPGQKPPPEDPFERMLRQLRMLRDMVRQEMGRMAAGAVASTSVQGMDFSQDLLIGDFDSELWQNMASVEEVWNVVGDPGVLDAGMQQ